MIESMDSPYIIEATSNNFKPLVLENSKQGPVLVNFWSRNAGPCLRQYPVLDLLVQHYDGRLLLINVDAEKEIAVTNEYDITSIPTLKLFRNQQVVATMHGYQNEEDLLKLLEQYVARDSDLTLADAIRLYTDGKKTEAYETIANAIVEDPVNPRLPLTFCKLLKHEERYIEALALIDALPPDIRNHTEVAQLHDLLTFHREVDTSLNIDNLVIQVDRSPDDLEAIHQLTAQYVVRQQHEKALQQLANMMEIDPGYRDNYPRNAMLKVFNILGSEHALVREFRPSLKRYAH
ncbi:MAG: tetratricopeptide repeat protein [Gammaproteobacteria bacterium]|nr:tetratricopeptide repeat protein [Gammaproteobacteria bacterium]